MVMGLADAEEAWKVIKLAERVAAMLTKLIQRHS